MRTASITSSRSTAQIAGSTAQLGLCFCEHCVAGAKRAGIQVDLLRRRVASDIEAYLASDVDFPSDMAEAFWLADTRADGDLAAFLDWRCTVVTSLVHDIRDAVRKTATVAVIPSVARPTGGAWYEGSDLKALAGAAGVIEACFYEPGASRIKADLHDVRASAARRRNPSWHLASRLPRSRGKKRIP